jgi:RimJ/RimL family protein N-acetyltransferase
MKIVLETPRLVLREMTLDDLDFIAGMLADEQVMRFYPQRYDRADADAWVRRNLDRYARDGHGQWLALVKETGQPVGQVGLVRMEVDGVDEPEVGYIIHRPFWRRGYASEAACAVRDHAFTVRERDHVISLIRPINHPSQGVARKMGMRPTRFTLHAGLEHLVFRVERGET